MTCWVRRGMRTAATSTGIRPLRPLWWEEVVVVVVVLGGGGGGGGSCRGGISNGGVGRRDDVGS